jgi:hypothetical protein
MGVSCDVDMSRVVSLVNRLCRQGQLRSLMLPRGEHVTRRRRDGTWAAPARTGITGHFEVHSVGCVDRANRVHSIDSIVAELQTLVEPIAQSLVYEREMMHALPWQAMLRAGFLDRVVSFSIPSGLGALWTRQQNSRCLLEPPVGHFQDAYQNRMR